jgi:beta-N-acetylglucosaminidase
VARFAIQLELTKKIQGVAEYDRTDTIVDVAQQLPPNSYMVMLYSPIDSQKGLIKNAINQMIVDRSVLEVDQNGMPHSRSLLICTQSYLY